MRCTVEWFRLALVTGIHLRNLALTAWFDSVRLKSNLNLLSTSVT